MRRLLAVLLATGLLSAAMPAMAADPPPDSCPLATKRYQALPVKNHLAGAVGEKITLAFTLEPPEPPVGFFLSVNMSVIEAPEAAKIRRPEVLTGFPESTVVFRAPGTYRYGVVVSLIAKSSCGGVKADTLYTGRIRIDVHP